MTNTQDFKSLWNLDDKITFLNHGSFGACPQQVLAEQNRLRARLESEPVRFFIRDFFPLLDAARKAVAAFIKADSDDLAFVTNATTGVNTVLRSLHLAPGDEIMVTDQGYAACTNAAQVVSEIGHASLKSVAMPFPVASEDEIVAAILATVTSKTRLAIIDHITSPTALIYPVHKIVKELAARNVDVLVDGAHAPGMVALDLRTLAPAYYTGNCHKWLCAPKGSAFLYVRADRRDAVMPLVISHGLKWPTAKRSHYHNLFDWPGTFDPTPYLSVPFAIAYLGSLLPGGWEELCHNNHRKVVNARSLLCRELGLEIVAPEHLLGAMATMILPHSPQYRPDPQAEIHPLQDALFHQFGIEVPVMSWANRLLLRISAQLYNHEAEYLKLLAALRQLVHSSQ